MGRPKGSLNKKEKEEKQKEKEVKLNQKELDFCKYVVEGLSGQEAAQKAGYCINNKNSAKVTACNMLKKQHIREYINYLKTEAIKQADLDIITNYRKYFKKLCVRLEDDSITTKEFVILFQTFLKAAGLEDVESNIYKEIYYNSKKDNYTQEQLDRELKKVEEELQKLKEL